MDGFQDIVSVQWLNKNINHPKLVILDASIVKVANNTSEVSKQQIPNARFFDIKKKFSDTSSEFPNTIPSEIQFEQSAQQLGINKDSFIVVYDSLGIYSSPRAWWLFKTFGHQNAAILDGGLPKWVSSGFSTVNKQDKIDLDGNFEAKFNKDNVVFIEELDKISRDDNYKIIDARSSDRFNCIVAEPRKGLRSGSIPSSNNLPYKNILENNTLKTKEQLKQQFETLAHPNQHLVFTCGSGITACILSLAATTLGYSNSVYDGSWTEYGSLTK